MRNLIFLAIFLSLGLFAAPGTSGPAPLRPGTLAAPRGRLAFQTYGAAQNLGNLNIWALEEDADGFLWAGTADGLFRYDGNRFQGFGLEDGLPSPFIRAICVEGRSRLWLGTLHGLAVREAGKFRAFTAKDGLPEGEVFALARDRQGRLWVAMDLGLFRQRAGSLAFDPAPGWPAKTLARALAVDGNELLVTSQARLLRYDLSGSAGPQEVPGPWKERLDSLAKDAQGRLWVRSRAFLWMRPAPAAPFLDLSSRLSPATFDGHLRLTRGGDLLIPTSDCLMRVHGDTWEALSFKDGLPTPWTHRAMEDREGCLWVGGLGLYRDLAQQVWRQHTQQSGLSGGVCWAILKTREGRILAGTTNGLCEAREGAWQVVAGTQNQAFLALAEAPDGALWMGGAPARLRRWMPKTGQWFEFEKPGSTITSMVFGPEGELWVGTRREGLFRVTGSSGAFALEPYPLPGAIAGERVMSMCRQGDRIWMASTQGLLVLEGGQWRRLGVEAGLLSRNLHSAFQRQNGDLWVVYEDKQGLSRFTWDHGKLTLQEHLDQSRGFSAHKAYFLRDDVLGRLWVGTSQGVVMFDGAQWHTFASADGLPGDDCDGAGFLAEPNGDIWVGTLGGLGHFDSARYQGSPKPPAAFILSAEYGDQRLVGGAFPAAIRIPRDQANVEFHFTGRTYLYENQVRHQIRLVGLDDEWRNYDFRQIRYTKLPPGAYRFEVRAGFADGRYGTPAVLAFQVLPSWWQTWWFRSLAILAGIGLVVAGIRLRLRSLQRRNQVLEAQVQARTQALAEANQSLQQLTVTDPLTGLKNRRFLDLTIEEDLAKVNRDYHTVRKGQENRMGINVDLLFMMADLDHFKWINDEYGHAAGDRLLQQVRDRLLEAVRDTDTVVRWGGEEFLLVARNVDRSQAEILANRVLELIRSTPFDLGNGNFITKTCSLGFALYPFLQNQPPNTLTWQQVVEVADRCLYAAKESGRDGWVGLLHGGDDAADVPRFISQPEVVLADPAWHLLASFPDLQALRWR